MRIGINALSAENRSGTGRYATELVSQLARLDSREATRRDLIDLLNVNAEKINVVPLGRAR